LIDNLNENVAVAIRKAKQAFNDASVVHQLAYIQSNFAIIPQSIKTLETAGLPLSESLNELEKVKTTLARAEGPIGETIPKKLKKVLEDNPGIGKLVGIAKLLIGEEAEIGMAPNLIAAHKYAPVTSCDVERSF
jgi:hypothetical protein